MKKSRSPIEGLKPAFVFFPFAIFGMQHFGVPLSWQLVVAGGATALNLNYRRKAVLTLQLTMIALLAILLIELKPDNLPRIYPFLMSATALMAFITSWRGDGAILANYASKFVRLSPERRIFLRSMVPLWVLGLLLNTLILLVLVFFFPLKYWAWYSGFASYILFAGLLLWTIVQRSFSAHSHLAPVPFATFAKLIRRGELHSDNQNGDRCQVTSEKGRLE